MSRSDSWGDMLDALSNPYRRQLLVALLEHNSRESHDYDPLDLVSAPDEPDVLETELFHTHLPKLEEMGFIEWDQEADVVTRGPRWGEIGPLVELLHDHRDELPDGWL